MEKTKHQRSLGNSEKLVRGILDQLKKINCLPMACHDFEDLGSVSTVDFQNVNGKITETKERRCFFQWNTYEEYSVTIVLRQTVSRYGPLATTTLPEDPNWWLAESITIERTRPIEGPENIRAIKLILEGKDCLVFLEQLSGRSLR